MAKAVKVLLADDHALVRSGMKALLIQQEGIEVVGEAADGQAALLAVEQLRPDVLLLDISLPGLNGLELLSRLKTHAPLTAVVVLSMHDAEEYVLRAYQEGALSYLTKDAPAEHLVAAVRAAGHRPAAPGELSAKLGRAACQALRPAHFARARGASTAG